MSFLAFQSAKVQEFTGKYAQGDFISFSDLKTWIEPCLYEYTDGLEIRKAVQFFDADNDGKIAEADLRSMLKSFAQTENNYCSDAEIAEIIKLGQKMRIGTEIDVEFFIKELQGNWARRYNK